MEFQARIGPFADGIDEKLDLILARQSLKGQVKAGVGVLGVVSVAVWEFVIRRGGDLPR